MSVQQTFLRACKRSLGLLASMSSIGFKRHTTVPYRHKYTGDTCYFLDKMNSMKPMTTKSSAISNILTTRCKHTMVYIAFSFHPHVSTTCHNLSAFQL